jgi:23S rRNA pseudouridine1911/1915/1917 synthase
MKAGISGGRQAKTVYRVIRRFPKTSVALVWIKLLTGRTHQARVHLASIGAPVLADPVYGRNLSPLVQKFPSLKALLTRQFLHARRLTIPKPGAVPEERLTFWAPWPADFRSLFEELRRLESPPGQPG